MRIFCESKLEINAVDIQNQHLQKYSDTINAKLMNEAKELLEKYWGYLALLIWIAVAVALDLVRLNPFAIDEEAAKGLLLTWTVSDNIVNPIVVFGLPDFRALLYIPVGTYWPGSLLAAKILSLTIAFIAVSLLYKWAKRTSSQETALIASALLLVSPALITQVDSMSAGPYIIMGFALGVWLDNAYRKNEKYFGGWYFSQMLWVAILSTLHPIALAYPLVIAWNWYKNPHATKKSRHMFVGLFITITFALLLRMGWHNFEAFQNPIEFFATSLQGAIIWSEADISWWPGIIAALLLALVIMIDLKNISKDVLSQMIIVCLALGIIMPDSSWAFIGITFLIYRGTHHLIQYNQSKNKQSTLGQRGVVFAIAFIVCAFFMLQDKYHVLTIKHAILAPEDELIQSLMAIAEDDSKPFRIASQWPGRTMLATKRDVYPLPPAIDDREEMLEAIQSVTHLAFNPYDPKNKALSDAIANLGSETETHGLLKAGAIIEVRNHNVKLSTQQRLDQQDDVKE